MAPEQSINTSHGVPVRPGKNVWCSSSALAVIAVPNSASSASVTNTDFGSVNHHARSHASASKPYLPKQPIFAVPSKTLPRQNLLE